MALTGLRAFEDELLLPRSGEGEKHEAAYRQAAFDCHQDL